MQARPPTYDLAAPHFQHESNCGSEVSPQAGHAQSLPATFTEACQSLFICIASSRRGSSSIHNSGVPSFNGTSPMSPEEISFRTKQAMPALSSTSLSWVISMRFGALRILFMPGSIQPLSNLAVGLERHAQAAVSPAHVTDADEVGGGQPVD